LFGERPGLGRGQVDHDHVGPHALRRLDRLGGGQDVDAVDVRSSENGGSELAGKTVRTDDQKLQHRSEV